MIISASRRTDIPAFHSRWFMERVREGYCDVSNPFRPSQISRISLTADTVDCLVFWSKNPSPLLRYLPEFDARSLRYYFQFTLNGYPQVLETHLPPVGRLISIFRRLSDTVGPKKVIWRYDPILISSITDFAYHQDHFAWLASELAGYTHRVVVSIFDWYPFLHRRMSQPQIQALQVMQQPENNPQFGSMMHTVVEAAQANGMQIYSCAEPINLQTFGVIPGSCIDAELIQNIFGIKVSQAKDAGQRPACGCVKSRDIGTYGTCRFGCVYCYSKRSVGLQEQHT
jgi:hypothetical protein